MVSPSVLLVHPAAERERVSNALETAGYQVETADTATEAVTAVATGAFDCLVSEYALPGDDGLTLRSAVRKIDPQLPFVLFTDVDDVSIPAADTDRDRLLEKNGEQSVRDLVSTVTRLEELARNFEPQQDISGHEPSTEELTRAIEAAPIGVSLSDPSLADYPLVYVNDAWGDFTGYDTDEVLGRNPRLLQGTGTDPRTVKQLSEAIGSEQAISREIRNYKKDGTPFWNEVTVAPIHDEDGELVHYVGFQIDITDRREAEALAEQRADRLAEEQQTLRRILDRVNGLLSEISRVLVEASNKDVIIHQVCEEIAADPGYTAAWIGAAADDQLSMRAHSGLGELPVEIPLSDVPVAVSRAIETDECHVCSTGVGGPLDPVAVDGHRLLVIPLCYRDRRYGLLGVYGSNPNSLDEREQQVFGSIGKMLSNGIHAAETTQILTTDRITELQIKIRDETFHLARIASHLGVDVERCGATRSADGEYVLYLAAETTPEAVDSLDSLSCLSDVRFIAERDGELTFSVTIPEETPYDDLAEAGAVVTAMTATPTQTQLTVETPPEQDVRTLLDMLRASYEGVELRARTQRDRRERRPSEFAAAVDEQLTDRQQAALESAHLNGYFEWPRPVDGDEIAKTMDITRQTFHQHLRAAEQKLVAAYVES